MSSTSNLAVAQGGKDVSFRKKAMAMAADQWEEERSRGSRVGEGGAKTSTEEGLQPAAAGCQVSREKSG